MAARRTGPSAPPAPAGLPGHLVSFVGALRRAGIPVGPSQTVDAGAVLVVLGLGDRETLREGLACALIRRGEHRQVFDAAFDLWFPAALGERAAAADAAGLLNATREIWPTGADLAALRDVLLDVLLSEPDRGTPGGDRLTALIAAIVAEHGRYASRRGPAYSAYQALKAIGPDELEARLLAGLLSGYGDQPSPAQRHVATSIAAQRISAVRTMVEAETRRRAAELLGREHVRTYGVPQLTENVEFLRASAEQLRQLRRTVAPLARTLATRLAVRRRRARAGAIDLRKTLRASMSTGGVPVKLVPRTPRPARPELVVLCDVSGSVAGFSQFTLGLVSALRQQFSRVRVFAFVDTTDEVSALFGPDADLAVAVQRILAEADVHTADGHSDYGHAFASFRDRHPGVLSPRSSLLVLGDGRTNYRNPRADLLAEMVAASRHAHWLNPEPQHLWNTGDSAVARYAEVITMHECRTAAQLAEVVDGLLTG